MSDGQYRVQRYRVALVRDGVQRFACSKAPNRFGAAAALRPFFRDLPHEEVWGLLMDHGHSIRGAVRLAQGGIATAALLPMDVFRPVIAAAAPAFVLGHNHPSGDPRPSREDIDMTRRLVEAGNLLGVQLLDHIVFGRGDTHASIMDDERW